MTFNLATTLIGLFFSQIAVGAISIPIDNQHYLALYLAAPNIVRIKECLNKPVFDKKQNILTCRGKYIRSDTDEVIAKNITSKDLLDTLQTNSDEQLNQQIALLLSDIQSTKDLSQKKSIKKMPASLKTHLLTTLLDPFSTTQFIEENKKCLISELTNNQLDEQNNICQKIEEQQKAPLFAATEITQLQWFFIMGNNPSTFKDLFFCPEANHFLIINDVPICATLPVESITPAELITFFKRLEKITGRKGKYSLPTLKEWQKLVAGLLPEPLWQTPWSKRASEKALNFAWLRENTQITLSPSYIDFYNGSPRPVRRKKMLHYGLYDLFGNVHEIVLDERLTKGPYKFWAVGGSWTTSAQYLQKDTFFTWESGKPRNDIGFRLVKRR